MATLVCFHAHPDDESIATGGTMAMATDAGHRVVLVLATRGEHGEVPEGFLEPGEALGDRRAKETAASAEVLGVARLELLGYVDSGMVGTPTNDAPGAFCRADEEEAAMRLAAILVEERADVLTVYDDHGGYGHPDHIQIHRVGIRAAELAGIERVYESTMNRTRILALMQEGREQGLDLGAADDPVVDVREMGTPEAGITTAIDVGSVIDRKRASMRCHRSQISDQSFFLSMPEETFARAFGTEWYIRRGTATPVDAFSTSLLDDLG